MDEAWRKTGRQAFGEHLKPRLLRLLEAIQLDVLYERGEGDRLWYRSASGQEIEVLDFLGGYGASFLGHNHPVLVELASGMLTSRRPFNAQASVRGAAGLLARRLSEAVGRCTGSSYVATLANSGAEAVEAAIKHGELELYLRMERTLKDIDRTARRFRNRIRYGGAFIPDGFFEKACELLGIHGLGSLSAVLAVIMARNVSAFETPPTFLALEGSFHGKTTGAVNLTHSFRFRGPWHRLQLGTRFLPCDDPDSVSRELDRARIRYVDLVIGEDGALDLVERFLVNVSACFVEPIQGEGGIREVPVPMLQALRGAADKAGFPLVIDEIQTGLGRTGALLASEQAGVTGDYYLFSKALGGGLAKISALLIDQGRYLEQFGEIHTSTFADDDFASEIGLGVLDIIERDDGHLMSECRRKGDLLLASLQDLRERYPDQLADIRGRGLMVGFELKPQCASPSALLRVLSEQSLLAYVVSGYLLKEHGIRVAPTLSDRATIRLEPSAYITEADLDRFTQALEELLGILADGDSFRFVRHIVGRELEPAEAARHGPAGEELAPAEEPAADTITAPRARRVAFLGHFLEPADMRDWDPSLSPFSDEDCRTLLDRTRSVLEPFVVKQTQLRSRAGDLVDLIVLGLPFTSAQALEAWRQGRENWAVDVVRQGVRHAKRLGARVVGMGGYSSIITDNCRAIVEDEMALTSGNSLAAAATLRALEVAAERVGVRGARLGVVGGAGNIGAALAEVAADSVGDIVLVGRRGARPRLERVTETLYAAAWDRLVRGGENKGLARAISETATVARLRDIGSLQEAGIGEALRRGLQEERGEEAPIRITTDLADLRTCNLIVSASNAPHPIIHCEHLGEAPVVVCDAATPGDLDPAVHEQRPDVEHVRGGMIRLPLGQQIRVAGLPLDPGVTYACLAETVLLGFSDVGESFSFGNLDAARIRRIYELAVSYGFTIETNPET